VPDGVREETPFALIFPTDKRDGRAGVEVAKVAFLGILDGVPSSIKFKIIAPQDPEQGAGNLPVLSKDIVDPCLEGGLDPLRLAGREFGFELPRETGVVAVLFLEINFLG
jgi:hypothetical protein